LRVRAVNKRVKQVTSLAVRVQHFFWVTALHEIIPFLWVQTRAIQIPISRLVGSDLRAWWRFWTDYEPLGSNQHDCRLEKTKNFSGAIRGHEEFPRCPFNDLEGQAAPQNSFVSISLVNSRLIGQANFPFSFQYDTRILKGR
jgi:hypothetical protein